MNNIQPNAQAEVSSQLRVDQPQANNIQSSFLRGLGRDLQASNISQKCADIRSANAEVGQTLQRELGAHLFREQLMNPGRISADSQSICLSALRTYQAAHPDTATMSFSKTLVESYMTPEERQQQAR